MLTSILLLGSGKIGECIATLLSKSGRYRVKIADHNTIRGPLIASKLSNTESVVIDASDRISLTPLIKNSAAVISALPFHCNRLIAEIAIENGVHYFDLTEDVSTTSAIIEMSKNAKSFVMPQCGLAPGFISIAAFHLLSLFEKVERVKMRVGALPIYPSNRLKYNLTWSTEGLINEYINPCHSVENGERKLTPALEGYERFSLDGSEYEAFNTSGGLGTLCDTLQGRVNNLDYKSVRYPGHRELMAFLLQEMGFADDRQTLIKTLEKNIPSTTQDKCIIFVEVQGISSQRFYQKTYVSTVYNQNVGESHFGAIQITTAAGICGPLDLLLSAALPHKPGLVRAEEIPLSLFLNNEFGCYYKDEKALAGLGL